MTLQFICCCFFQVRNFFFQLQLCKLLFLLCFDNFIIIKIKGTLVILEDIMCLCYEAASKGEVCMPKKKSRKRNKILKIH